MINRIRYFAGLFVLLVMACVSCETEGPDDFKRYFIKYFGGDGDQEANDFLLDDDGSIVMVGSTFEPTGDKKVYVVKADAQGNEVWSLKFGGATNESGQNIQKITSGLDAGSYLIVSNAEKNVEDSLAIRLTVVSETGDSVKSFLIDRYESQEAKSITGLTTGEYLITGTVKNTDTLNAELIGVFDLEDSFNMVIGNDFTLISSERFGTSTVAAGIKIIDRPNSVNYALYTDEWTVGESTYESNFVFRRYDKNTNDRESFYAGSDDRNEYLADVDQSGFGEYLAVGTQVNPSSNSTDIYACRINSNYLTVLNQGTISGGPPQAEGIAVTRSLEDGFFWVLGNEIRAGGSDRNIWIGKVNASNLTAVFSRKFGASNNDDVGSKILQLRNGDILILGTMELVNQKKMALIKIKADGSF
jgi:hypothetical protein